MQRGFLVLSLLTALSFAQAQSGTETPPPSRPETGAGPAGEPSSLPGDAFPPQVETAAPAPRPDLPFALDVAPPEARSAETAASQAELPSELVTQESDEAAQAVASSPEETGTRASRIEFEDTSLPSGVRACLANLEESGVRFTRLPNSQNAQGCGLTNAVRVTGFGDVTLSPAGDMTCTMAERTQAWVEGSVAEASTSLLGAELTGMGHWSAYSCRTIRGTNRLSQHATGNALDIAVFYLSDGRQVRVLEDWGSGTSEARFLERVSREACGYYQLVLNPLSDAAHRDHFHLDAGRWRSCPY